MRLEVRWRREKSKIDLEKVLKKYIEALRSGTRRKKFSFTEVKTRDAFQNIRLPDKEKRYFSWSSEGREVFNLVAQCNSCYTITMVQAFLSEKDAENIPEILNTLEDHTSSDFLQWAVYDFRFSVPSFLTLGRFSLKSGYLEFNFSGPGAEVKLRRWGLADIILRDIRLEQWCNGIAPKVFRGKISRGHRQDIPPDEILQIAMRRWSWHAFYCRRCTTMNKIYALDYAGRKQENLFNRIASKILCH